MKISQRQSWLVQIILRTKLHLALNFVEEQLNVFLSSQTGNK